MTNEGFGTDVRPMEATSPVATHPVTQTIRVLKGAISQLRSRPICNTVLHRMRLRAEAGQTFGLQTEACQS